MKAPEDIEAMLQRLMPVAISPGGHENIEAIFGKVENVRRRPRWIYPSVAVAAAAVGTFILLPSKSATPSLVGATAPLSGMVLVNSSDRLESMVDEGFQNTPDGDAVHAMRLQMVEECTVRDEETGMVISLSQPRDELVLVPVTSF